MNDSVQEVTKEKLIADFNAVIGDTEQLLKSVANEKGVKAKILLGKVEENLKIARQRFRELRGHAVEKSKAAAKVTDDYVHENPWKAIGIAAGIGVVIGLLLSRR